MTKINTVQNGKGDKWRKSTNYKAYWEAEIWSNLKKPTKSQKTSLEHSSPDKQIKSS